MTASTPRYSLALAAAVCACLASCQSRTVGVHIETPGVTAAVLRKVNGKAKRIRLPRYARLLVHRRGKPVGESNRPLWEGVSLEIETTDGVVSRAYLSTFNSGKIIDHHFVTGIVSLGGPGSWTADDEVIRWERSGTPRGRFVYVLGHGATPVFEGKVLPAPRGRVLAAPRRSAVFPEAPLLRSQLHREFEGELHQVDGNPCTIELAGLEIQCAVPEGTLLRVEQLRSASSLVELRGLLAHSTIVTSSGDHDATPERLASPLAAWARLSLPPGAGIRVLAEDRSDLVRINRKSGDEQPVAFRVQLIRIGEGSPVEHP